MKKNCKAFSGSGHISKPHSFALTVIGSINRSFYASQAYNQFVVLPENDVSENSAYAGVGDKQNHNLLVQGK